MDGAKDIILYGAGNCGRKVVNIIKKMRGGGIVKCFLDKNAGNNYEYLGIPVYKLDDTRLDAGSRKDALVIFSLILPFQKDYDEIEEKLRFLGYTRFVNANYLFGMCLNNHEETINRGLFTKEVEDIALAFGFY